MEAFKFEELPPRMRQQFSENWPQLLSDFMQLHDGHCFALQCKECQCLAFFCPPQEFFADPQRIWINAECGGFSVVDLTRSPCRLKIHIPGHGPGHVQCPRCSRDMRLTNPVIDALESATFLRQRGVRPDGVVPPTRSEWRSKTKCGNCGAQAPRKKCAACLGVRYCSEACQRNHWRAHKSFCRLALNPLSYPDLDFEYTFVNLPG